MPLSSKNKKIKIEFEDGSKVEVSRYPMVEEIMERSRRREEERIFIEGFARESEN